MARSLDLHMMAAADAKALRAVNEHDFSVAVRRFAEAQGWTVWYTRVSAKRGTDGQWKGLSPRGEPDLRMVRVPLKGLVGSSSYPNLPRQVIFAELKTEAGRLTTEQEAALEKLGPFGRLWRPRDARGIIEELT